MIHLFSINPLNEPQPGREQTFSSEAIYRDLPGVFVQTCNRTEWYGGTGELPEYIARHLFRVVSGLKSNLLGEIAIQGQIKTAYREACLKYKLDKGIHHLFQYALYVGKRVRNESGISRGAISHSQAVVEIIINKGIPLCKTLISLIGAHKLNEDIIRFLQSKGAETIFLANRSFEKASEIAKRHQCQIMRLDQLGEMLAFSDILITATSAPHLIVKYEYFPKNRNMLILDLALPRDVDEQIGTLPGVTLYNISDIENRVNQNIQNRAATVDLAEKIIEEELVFFYEKQKRNLTYASSMAK
jgi:glutamyl-tRNA reductase